MKTKDKTKRKVTFNISEEEIFLFQSYFLFSSPCKKHQENYHVDEIAFCEDCKKNHEIEGDKLHEIGERIITAYWKKHYKAPKLSLKEKKLLKIIKSKDWDIILFYEAIVKVGESLGLTHTQAENALKKFEAMGEIYYPAPGQIDCPKSIEDDPWKDLPEADSSKEVIKLNENQLTIFKIIKKEMNTGLDMIPKEDILFLAKKNGFNKQLTLETLESLEKSGDLYKPRKDFYKPTKINLGGRKGLL